MNIIKIAIIFLAVCAAGGVNAKELTLEDIRSELIGKEVVIISKPLNRYTAQASRLRNWNYVKVRGDSSYAMRHASVHSSVRGKKGIVVAVNAAISGGQQQGKDLFGNDIQAREIINPYMDVIVELVEDGTLIGITGYYISIMSSDMKTAEQLEIHKTEISNVLNNYSGKTVYSVAYSQLRPISTSLNALINTFSYGGLASGDRSLPNFTPMKVIDSKYLDLDIAVVLKLEAPDSTTRLIFGDSKQFFLDSKEDRSDLEKIGIDMLDEIPSKLTIREINAIKESKIFRGMSEDALFYSRGYPEKSNRLGVGEMQFIYGSNQYVYMKDGVVHDWQRF